MNYKFIKLSYNSKIPISGQRLSKDDAHELKNINTDFFNVGLLAGVNNLLILDIDEKKGGLLEWSNYTSENFEPYTMKQKTPGGGFHYVFLHHSDEYTEEENEAIKRLKNKSEYRGKGIDIRKGNGYIVFNGSSIDGKEYKLLNDLQPGKIPLKLVNWILEFEMEAKTNINNNIVIMDDEYTLKEYLKNFNNVSSRMWLKITTAIKYLLNYNSELDENKIKKIWNSWSKKQDGYNKENNFKIWERVNSNISLNYIINQYNKTKPKEDKLKFLESFKPLEELTTQDDIKKLTITNKFLYDELHTGDQFGEEQFLNYNTIIIKSTTGTGKTSATAKHLNKYFKDNKQFKFLSIVNLITLASQHLESFKNIKLVSYQDKNINKDDDNVVICLNSLMMYSKYNSEFFNNYIVYIDEITSLINSLTHNNTLDRNLKGIYIVLMKILKNAHKVIVSDATINLNTFSLLKNRNNDKKLYIENLYKKYENIPVYKYNNENEFLEQVKTHVSTNDYFLFGCDSLNITDAYFNNVIDDSKKENSILITSESKFNIVNASEQFYKKFVFYSPSITTAVDFTIDTPQDVFLYINGKTIDPATSFQQLSRTRNIRNVYLYVSEIESKPAKYNTLDNTKKHLKDISKYEKETTLNKMCGTFNEYDEYVFNENSFFNIYSFNEYLKDTYDTNKNYHFFLKLYENGFKLSEIGENEKLNKKTKQTMKDKQNEVAEEKFENEIIKLNNNIKTDETTLSLAMDYLNIEDEATARKYQDILQDKFKREDYFNLIKLLRTKDYILNKLKKTRNNMTGYKVIYNTFYKVSLIWELEEELKIETRFNFKKLDIDIPYKITDELHKKINTAFRSEKFPETYNGFIEYYYNKISNIIGNMELLNKVRKTVNKKRQIIYSINEDTLNEILTLYELSDSKRKYIFNSPFFKPIVKKENKIKDDLNFLDNLETGFYDPAGLDYMM